MPITSAAPDDLITYVGAAAGGTTRLTTAAAELRGALGAFRASEGRAAFLADVPEVDLDLSFLVQRWDRLAGWLDGVARAFVAADSGTFTVDDHYLDRRAGRFVAPEVEVIERDGRLILDTGLGDDVVWLDDRGDLLVVTVNDTEYGFEVGAGDEVVVRAGAGVDAVASAPRAGPTREGLVLEGGSGDDELTVGGGGAVVRGGAGTDRIIGGAGADRLLGGADDDVIDGKGGDDRIIGGAGDDALDGGGGDDWVSGGVGEDLVHGEAGADQLTGGDGRDHVDGGAGVDHVGGGADADVLAGGEGHDTVSGGEGSDVAIGGPGHDLVIGGGGADGMQLETGDVAADATRYDDVHRQDVDLTLLDSITVMTDGALANRIRADLVTLASTATGARLLESLRGRSISVVGPGALIESGDAFAQNADAVQYDPRDDEAGFGPAGANRPADSLSYSPLVSLAHELIHASHDVNGTRAEGTYGGEDLNQLDTNRDGVVDGRDRPVENEERATVGLPIDHDEDPSTPDVSAAEVIDGIVAATENQLRDELGLAIRGRY